MQTATESATTLLLTFSDELRVELGLGKVRPEKEAWMFGVYLPAANTELAEYERGRVGAFAVIASNAPGTTPAMGALNTWPSVETFEQLLSDERFTRTKPERDAAMEVLDDRHILTPIKGEVEVETQRDYALVLAAHGTQPTQPLIVAKIADDSINPTYIGRAISLHPWTAEIEALMDGTPEQAIVYRIRFGGPAN